MQRPVNILMSKKLRIVVVCQHCPVSPHKMGGNQKSACLFLRKGNREQRRKGIEGPLVKMGQCEWYGNDSLKKLESGINVLECTFNSITTTKKEAT